jgi:hypothetical protein
MLVTPLGHAWYADITPVLTLTRTNALVLYGSSHNVSLSKTPPMNALFPILEMPVGQAP